MKKYQEYKIIVTYMNGDKEEINYKGINTSNYKDMIKLYSDIKEEYSDKSATIDFVGINNENELKVFWTKKVETKEEIKDTRVQDILINIKSNLELLVEKEKQLNTKQGIIDKQQDIELHKIETINEAIFNTEQELVLEKVKIVDTIHNIRKERRTIKNEMSIMGRANNIINKHKTIADINKLLKSLDDKQDKKYEYLTEEKTDEFKIMKRLPYRTEKERIKLISELKPKYSKVYYESGEIICYNKAN